jgi:hypothetical protein
MQEASQQLYYKRKFEEIDKAIDGLRKAVDNITLPKNKDEQLEAEGWIKHFGDICPVHELDDIIAKGTFPAGISEGRAGDYLWGNITHYKVTKKYVEPKPAKKLVDWSCPLLEGCNTNFGELLDKNKSSLWIASSQWNRHYGKDLRLLPPATPTSNWQVYHQGETNLQTLHDAGFEIEIKYAFSDCYNKVHFDNTTYKKALSRSPKHALHYRVIGIRDGFTDVPESAT